MDVSGRAKYNIIIILFLKLAPARFEALEDGSVMKKRLTACACLTTIGLILLTVLPTYARHILYSISRDASMLSQLAKRCTAMEHGLFFGPRMEGWRL